MTTLDGIKDKLPSQARQQLVNYFYEKLKASRLDCYKNPMYRLAQALGDTTALDGDWIRSIVPNTFKEARKLYEERHPKEWDPERRLEYRVGLKL